MIKAIIFDLGKVIVSFDNERGVAEFAKYSNLSKEDIKELIYTAKELKLQTTGKISSRDFYEIIRELVGVKVGYVKFRRIWSSVFDLEPILSEEFIGKLAENYRIVGLSDTEEIHFKFLKKNLPVLRRFDDFALSFKIGYTKPAPEIFAAAVKKAKCEPHECLFTDDIAANVEGAKQCGLDAVQFISPEQFKAELKKRKIEF